jgi:hypothetical protein
MAGRHRRHFGETDRLETIKLIGDCREGAIRAIRRLDYNSDLALRLRRLLDVIDELAEQLTGDKTYFHAKGNYDPYRTQRSEDST